MPLVRCSKCGSHAGFVVRPKGSLDESQDIEVKGSLKPEQIRGKVFIICLHCNKHWLYPPEAPPPPPKWLVPDKLGHKKH